MSHLLSRVSEHPSSVVTQIILRTFSIATHYVMFNTTVIDGRVAKVQ